MALDREIGTRARQFTGELKLTARRRCRKARRDRIAQAAASVPMLSQISTGLHAAVGSVAQIGGCMAVHQALAGDQPDIARQRLLEQRLHRLPMHASPQIS
jgi:hypothetical protein